ncbi:hypothetical protein VNI00_004132 [Paramarasmius palmivorus]|uniref:DUF7330 domain-containing protein n=1 Tax=Paramarasmius palmivorus TaxID=297713 RepID=A0AAW0DMV2_9AGAR
MIIPEDAPTSPLKGQHPELPARQDQPPPSYGAVDQNQGRSVPYLQTQGAYPGSAQPYSASGPSYAHVIVPPSPHYPQLDPHEQRRIRRKTTRRFCQAFVLAILIWALVSILVQSMVEVAKFTGRHWVIAQNQYNIPKGVNLDHCLVPQAGQSVSPVSPYPYAAHVSFDLPADAETLLFLSRGSLSSGQLRVAGHEASTDVSVNVTVRYHRDDILAEAKICKLVRESGEIGVGILTPKWWPGRGSDQNLYFDVDISLPLKPAWNRRLDINRFETDLSNFKHIIEDLSGRVYFKDLILKSSNEPVFAESLSVGNATVQTSNSLLYLKRIFANNVKATSSNGPIRGKYDASGSITLETSNAPIDVDVDVTATDSEGKLFMETSNNNLKAAVKFHSTKQASPYNDKFLVRAVTSNGPLNLDIKEMPLDSTLSLEGKTSNGYGDVWLPAPYEGSYTLKTSNSPLILDQRKKDDPWWRGRNRHVEMNRSKLVMEGMIYWDEANKEKSSVSVKSSNAPLTLHL